MLNISVLLLMAAWYLQCNNNSAPERAEDDLKLIVFPLNGIYSETIAVY